MYMYIVHVHVHVQVCRKVKMHSDCLNSYQRGIFTVSHTTFSLMFSLLVALDIDNHNSEMITSVLSQN